MLKNFLLSWGMVIASAVLDSYAVLIIKAKLNEAPDVSINSIKTFWNFCLIILKSPLAISGIITYAIAPFLWLIALSRLQVTIAYPILVSLHLVIIPFFAVLFLGEGVNLGKIISFLLMIASIYILYNNQ